MRKKERNVVRQTDVPEQATSSNKTLHILSIFYSLKNKKSKMFPHLQYYYFVLLGTMDI